MVNKPGKKEGMKLLLSILLTMATVTTTYHRGEYKTYCDVDIECSQADVNQALDSLLADFEHNPAHLFQWAFYGTGDQTDKRKQGFTLAYDSVYYDTAGEMLTMNVTTYSPRGKADPMTITADLSDTRRPKGVIPAGPGGVGFSSPRVIVFEVHYPGSLVKSCGAVITLTPADSSDPQAVGVQHLNMETHCRFGWFFNLFISHKMYRNTVEWRFQQFLENMRCTAEHKPLKLIKVELVE